MTERVLLLKCYFLKGLFVTTFTVYCDNVQVSNAGPHVFFNPDHPKFDAQVSTQDSHCEGG